MPAPLTTTLEDICSSDGCDRVVMRRKTPSGNVRTNGKRCSTCHGLRAKYGITKLQRDNILRGQGGCCNICRNQVSFMEWHNNTGTNDSRAVIDHCHTSGKIRGVLCATCNLAIGKLKDSPVLLQRAIYHIEGKDVL